MYLEIHKFPIYVKVNKPIQIEFFDLLIQQIIMKFCQIFIFGNKTFFVVQTFEIDTTKYKTDTEEEW